MYLCRNEKSSFGYLISDQAPRGSEPMLSQKMFSDSEVQIGGS